LPMAVMEELETVEIQDGAFGSFDVELKVA
jgi:hypothetical protein